MRDWEEVLCWGALNSKLRPEEPGGVWEPAAGRLDPGPAAVRSRFCAVQDGEILAWLRWYPHPDFLLLLASRSSAHVCVWPGQVGDPGELLSRFRNAPGCSPSGHAGFQGDLFTLSFSTPSSLFCLLKSMSVASWSFPLEGNCTLNQVDHLINTKEKQALLNTGTYSSPDFRTAVAYQRQEPSSPRSEPRPAQGPLAHL